MSNLVLICTGAGLFFASGVVGLLPFKLSTAKFVSASICVVGAVVGLWGTALAFWGPEEFSTTWALPLGNFSLRTDALASIFLVLVFTISALGAVYGAGYGTFTPTDGGEKRLLVSYGLLAGSMVFVTIANDGIVFLIAWEIMALSAFFAATADSSNAGARRAGWVYLVATHAGTLALLLMFTLWKSSTGSFLMKPAELDLNLAGPIFGLALFGFGVKAGLVPLHFWLPDTHANAPSHVSALMSGVMLKVGVYGILRFATLLVGLDLNWGLFVIAIGALTGMAGISFALSQRDFKRFLAFSSVENVGLIVMSSGLALAGRALGRWDLVLFGLGGGLFHVLNHGLFKPLLFLSSGNVFHATRTRNIEQLGGLSKRMPWTSTLFSIGALAITGIFPLNGFGSEFLMFQGYFHALNANQGEAAALGAVVLTTIGALALAGFVKVYGTVFLGNPRKEMEHVHEAGAAQLSTLLVLALFCLALGFLPGLAFPLVDQAVRVFWPQGALVNQGALSRLGSSGILSWSWEVGLGLALAVFFLCIVFNRKGRRSSLTWDCGYARPTPRMQYSGTSVTEHLVRLTGGSIFVRRARPHLVLPFPLPAHLRTASVDPILDRLIQPLGRLFFRLSRKIRVFQLGRTQFYLFQILAFLLVLLVWSFYR